MRVGFLIAGALLVLLSQADSAAACARKGLSSVSKTAVPEAGIDQRLLNQAIVAEVNFHRCRAGLRPLSVSSNSLISQAKTHSDWMAKKKKLAHHNSIPGRETPGKRVASAGISYRAAAENLVMVHRFQIDNRRFKTVNRRQCQFAVNGRLVRTHSYASMARFAVDLWMASPAHRQNILRPDASITAVGASFVRDKYCGQFWLTQKLVS